MPKITSLKFRITENQTGKECGAPARIHVSVRAILETGVTAPVGSAEIIRFWSDKKPHSFLPSGYTLRDALGNCQDTLTAYNELPVSSPDSNKIIDIGLTVGDLFYIEKIYVNECWRGKGIGTQILDKIPQLLHKRSKDSPVIVTTPEPYDTQPSDTKYASEVKRLQTWCKRHEYKQLYPKSRTLIFFQLW